MFLFHYFITTAKYSSNFSAHLKINKNKYLRKNKGKIYPLERKSRLSLGEANLKMKADFKIKMYPHVTFNDLCFKMLAFI